MVAGRSDMVLEHGDPDGDTSEELVRGRRADSLESARYGEQLSARYVRVASWMAFDAFEVFLCSLRLPGGPGTRHKSRVRILNPCPG